MDPALKKVILRHAVIDANGKIRSTSNPSRAGSKRSVRTESSQRARGFSTECKHEIDDGRHQPLREHVRLLRGLQPKVLVTENVSGAANSKVNGILVKI
jgi:site-specific DNA-cytosine methylase